MGRYLKILISTVLLFLLYGFYYVGIPAVVNIQKRIDVVRQVILSETGFNTEIQNPKLKMGLTPSIWIFADNFSIVNDDNSKALEIKNFKAKIKLIPLIAKRIEVKTLLADEFNTNLVYDNNSELRLGQYNINIDKKVNLHKISADIKNYNIVLKDLKQSKNIELNGKHFTIDEFINNKKIKFSTTSQLKTGSKISKINVSMDLKLPLNKISNDHFDLNGKVSDFDLSDFSEYVKTVSKGDIVSLSGIINIDADTKYTPDKHKKINTKITANNIKIIAKDIKNSIISDGNLTVLTDINTITNGIDISEMTIKGDGISAFLSGKITKLNASIPQLDLNIGVDKSKAENFVKLLPPLADLSPDMNFIVLKHAGFWGDVSGNLEIKGKADYPNVYGNLMITNAYMVQPILNAEKAIIKLVFLGDKMNLDVKVPTSPTQTVWVTGFINLNKERSADLNIKSTDSVDLKTAQIVLNPLHDVFSFEMGPVPIMDIKGKGGINFHVTGTKKDPHGWGQFWFKDAVVSFLDIHNMEIKNGSGTLDFNNQDTYFQSKTAFLNGKPIFIKGTCSLDGNLNFDVTANGQDLGKLLNIIKTSPMLEDVQKLVKPIESAKGNADLNLNLTGKVKDVNNIIFNKNLFAKGSIKLLSNSLKLNGIPLIISNTKGNLNFNNTDADFVLKSQFQNSSLDIDGRLKDENIDIKVVSPKFNLGNGIQHLPVKIPYSKDLSTINTNFYARYNGKTDNIEYDKLYLKGKVYSNKGTNSSIIVNNSDFEINNTVLKVPMLKGTFKGSPYHLSLNILKPFSDKRVINGNGKISGLDLNFINEPGMENILSAEKLKQLNDFEFLNGEINLSARAWNNNYNVYTVLDNIKFKYKPQDVDVLIKSGDVLLHNNILNLNKINAQIENSPIFIDGKVFNIMQNPNLNLYVNLKPTQDLFDQIYNKSQIYPIKIKGDAIFTSKVTGNPNNLNAKSTLDINENSSLYYMGATVGDIENPVKISINNNYSPNKIKINNLQYDKIILSQNNKPFVKTQLNSSGTLTFLPDNNIGFQNFKVKTQNPTDAKIFNIIFRKPFMKQGVFSSDIIMNGTSLNPKITGKLDITSIDIPFFDSTIRDINLDFKNDKINISSKGTVLANDVYIDAVMKNKLIPPYIIEDLKLKLATLNINKITNAVHDIEAEAARTHSVKQENQPFDISQLIVKNSEISAKKIKVRNIDANNFFANLKITDKHIVNIDNFRFDIAQGSVDGDFKFDIDKNYTNLNIKLNNANALVMSEALFDLKGQVYGLINGDFSLSCRGNSNDNCFKTLSGNGNFRISDGKMPKLGSLEYLLKAGNLFKGGITGLSINSLVDLVTPLKTGSFESIYGDINISNGIADKVNIYSKGNDLNMYMSGSYNIVTSIADMKIFGSLSKNITTVFGKIKNASLNTLFNTIPGVNDSTEKLLLQEEIAKIPNIKNVTDIYRIFTVDVNGDINGTDYVKSFRWVK